MIELLTMFHVNTIPSLGICLPLNRQEGQAKIRSYQPQVTMQFGISQYTSHVLDLQDSFVAFLQNIILFM